jgi:hypothetical protein
MPNYKFTRNNLKNYIDKYIAYINKYDIKHFIEMDIDIVIGYEEVLKIRKYIKEKTGKKPIEVWHPWRGQDELYKSCDENEYICISIKEKKGTFNWENKTVLIVEDDEINYRFLSEALKRTKIKKLWAKNVLYTTRGDLSVKIQIIRAPIKNDITIAAYANSTEMVRSLVSAGQGCAVFISAGSILQSNISTSLT